MTNVESTTRHLPRNFSLNSGSSRSKRLQSLPNYSISDGTLPKFGGERGLAVNSKRDGRKGLACHDSPPWLDKSDTRNYAIPVCARGFKGRITARPSRENCSAWTVRPKIKGRSGTTTTLPPFFPCFCFIRVRPTLALFFAMGKLFVGTMIARVSVNL